MLFEPHRCTLAESEATHVDNFDKLGIVSSHSTSTELRALSGRIVSEVKAAQLHENAKSHNLARFQAVEQAARRLYAVAVAYHLANPTTSLHDGIAAITKSLIPATEGATTPIDPHEVFPRSIPLVPEMNIHVSLVELIQAVLTEHVGQWPIPFDPTNAYLPFCDPRYDLYSGAPSVLVDYEPGSTVPRWINIVRDLKDVISRRCSVDAFVGRGYSRRTLLDFITKMLDHIHPSYGMSLDHPFGQCARQLCFKLAVEVVRVEDGLLLSGIVTPERPLFGGRYAEVFKGVCEGQCYAVKRFRVEGVRDILDVQMALLREVSAWKRLEHPNILPFLGLEAQHFREMGMPTGMISPWMDHTLQDYSRAFGSTVTILEQMVYGTACGIDHLHKLDIVHADIKCKNILYNRSDYQARLADFGLVGYGSATQRVRPSQSGTTDHMAPELLQFESFRRSTASDIFAFACTIVEAYSARPLYDYTTSDSKRGQALERGVRPARPDGDKGLNMGPEMWKFVQGLWKTEPNERLSSAEIISYLEKHFNVR